MPRTTVVAQFIGQPAHLAAVEVHVVQIEITVSSRSEYDFPAVGGHRAFGVVSVDGGQALQISAVEFCGKDVERSIDRPDVSFRSIDRWRTIRGAQMSGRINHSLAVGREVAAGGA